MVGDHQAGLVLRKRAGVVMGIRMEMSSLIEVFDRVVCWAAARQDNNSLSQFGERSDTANGPAATIYILQKAAAELNHRIDPIVDKTANIPHNNFPRQATSRSEELRNGDAS